MSITKSHKSGLKQSYAAAIVLNRALLSLREYRTVSWRAWRNTVRFSTAGRNRRAFCGLFSPRGDGRGSGPEVPCYASGYSCAFGAPTVRERTGYRRLHSGWHVRAKPWGFAAGSARSLPENPTVTEQTRKARGIRQGAPPLPDQLQTPRRDGDLASR